MASRLGNTEACKILGEAEGGFRTPAQFDSLGMPWYHGRINRVASEHVLSLNGSSDGLFLVRFVGCVYTSLCF